MKGMLFVEFLDYLERHHGAETVELVIAEAEDRLSTAGAYTSVGNYPHGELLALLEAACAHTGADLEAAVFAYADHLMNTFRRIHPDFFAGARDVFDFLSSIDSVIHVEVRKLYPDASPPRLVVSERDDQQMVVEYQSRRPLGLVAHALIEAAGKIFEEPLNVTVLDTTPDQTRRVMRLERT